MESTSRRTFAQTAKKTGPQTPEVPGTQSAALDNTAPPSSRPSPRPQSLSPLLLLTEHVDEEKLGDIPVAELDVFFFEGRTDAGALLGHHPSLLRRRLARPHGPDQLPQLHRHGFVPRVFCCSSPNTYFGRRQELTEAARGAGSKNFSPKSSPVQRTGQPGERGGYLHAL